MYDDVKLQLNAYKTRIEYLEIENSKLRDRIDQLNPRKDYSYVIAFNLTPYENDILRLLMKRQFCTRIQLMDEIYSSDPESQPDMKIVDVFMCKLRAKLKKQGILINTNWGQGYYLTKSAKHQIIDFTKGDTHE